MNKRIKQLRKALDLTQQKFAERIGVKQNTVAQYEMGRNIPIDSVISLICKEFNVNEDWLRNGTGEMFVESSTFSLDEYAKLHNLNDKEITLIRNFMELDQNTRDALYNIFIKSFISDDHSATKEDSYICDCPKTPEELERQYPPIQAKNNYVG